MQIECALFFHDKAAVKVAIDAPAALREVVGKGRLPAAVVVRAADLGLFEERADLFKDRHQKDGRKGLSALLLGPTERIPYIDANFKASGRLKQSVNRLLENAEKARKSGIYVIGVNDQIFRDIWRKAKTEDESLQTVSSKKPLSQLLKPLPGEAQLSRTFWGDSPDYHLVRQLILRAAQIDEPVLILGETGTGTLRNRRGKG